jgi:hypothetical protein
MPQSEYWRMVESGVCAPRLSAPAIANPADAHTHQCMHQADVVRPPCCPTLTLRSAPLPPSA